MNREVILVTATWCTTCKIMLDWFFTLEIPGVVFKTCDVEDPEVAGHVISSVPLLLFVENGVLVMDSYGLVDKHQFKHMLFSLWPDLESQ